MGHPLLTMLEQAAHGHFPPADGGVEVLPSDGDGTVAVVAFSGHAVVLADVDRGQLVARMPAGVEAGLGGALHPEVLSWLAADGEVGSIDVVLVARGTAGLSVAPLGPGDPRDRHPRVVRARQHRRDVEVRAGDAGLAVLGRGLVGRRELSVELDDPSAVATGAGRRLIAAGLAAVPAGEWCWAQVAAGNARSLRAFLAAGFVPVCAEVLIGPSAPQRSDTLGAGGR